MSCIYLNTIFHFINIPPLLTVTLFFYLWNYRAFGAINTRPLHLFLCLFLSAFAHKGNNCHTKQLILYSFFAFFGAYLHQHELRTYNDFYELIGDAPDAPISGTIIDKNTVVSHHTKITR